MNIMSILSADLLGEVHVVHAVRLLQPQVEAPGLRAGVRVAGARGLAAGLAALPQAADPGDGLLAAVVRGHARDRDLFGLSALLSSF